jgi:hypothetical protein
LKAFHPEHLVKTVKDFDKPIGVERAADLDKDSAELIR